MKNSTTFFTELSLLEQASLSGGVCVTTVDGAGGNAIINGSSGRTVNGEPGKTVISEDSIVFNSSKLSKDDRKLINRLRKLGELFDD